MIETGVGIGVLLLSAALHHRHTMKLAILELSDPWAIWERAVIAREREGLLGHARTLIDELIDVAEAAGGYRKIAVSSTPLTRNLHNPDQSSPST